MIDSKMMVSAVHAIVETEKGNALTTASDRMKLFDEYSKVRYYILQVTSTNKLVITNSYDLSVQQVCVDKAGKLYVAYFQDLYDEHIKTAKVNAIEKCYPQQVEGVFLSDNDAIEVATRHFKLIYKEKMEEAERRLAKAKEEFDKYQNLAKEL
jgi:hypothetical protein